MGIDLADSRIVVLGGSGELGRRIARELASSGARVLLAGRDANRLSAVAGPLGAVATAEFDLRRAETFPAVLDAAEADLGGLDGVINAAGVVAFGDLTETPDDAIDELIAVDFVGPLKFMRHAAARMARGFWVNITGVVAEQPMAGLAPYSAAKAALSAASAAVARELRRLGIRVIDVRPPHTETGLAGRPVSGTAPELPPGLDPDRVAGRIVQAIRDGERVVTASSFG